MNEALDARRAIEALRAGVPSGTVVRFLGTDQEAVVARFQHLLSDIEQSLTMSRAPKGFLVRGRFGSGKSHLLKYLEQRALAQGFACTTLAVSKEVPLADKHEMFRASIRNLKLPDRLGGSLREVALKLGFDSANYSEFFKIIQGQTLEIDTLFKATLYLFEYSKDESVVEEMVSFWDGSPISAVDVRNYVRSLRGGDYPGLRHRPEAKLSRDRFIFAARLLRAAGYRGWVLLLDEVELVAKYSPKERLRSYGTIAAVLSLSASAVNGIGAVLAVTPDLDSVILAHWRDDEVKYANNWPELLTDGQLGFNAMLERSMSSTLERPSEKYLELVRGRARELYERCYGHGAIANGRRIESLNIRTFLRGLITLWDLKRLNPTYEPEIQSEELTQNLSEDADFGSCEGEASPEAEGRHE